MPGAGGMLAMNYLFNNAEKDGTVIGVVQSNTPLEPLFGTKEARYDAQQVRLARHAQRRDRAGAGLAHRAGQFRRGSQDQGNHDGRVRHADRRRPSSAA